MVYATRFSFGADLDQKDQCQPPFISFLVILVGKRIMIRLFVSLIFLCSATTAFTQEEQSIEDAIQGYITNFFLNDYDAMQPYLHDRLSKRGINADGQLSQDYSKADLKAMMQTKPVLKPEYQKNVVSDIQINQQAATAILDTGYPNTRWKEYIHLAKINDKWIVMDVFWMFDEVVEPTRKE